MRKKRNLILFLAALAAPAAAQSPSDPELYDRALAAGYKAQFLCSGLWNGGRTRDEVERDELTGIYDRIAAAVPALPAEIDKASRQVRVGFAETMPPRTAQWRAGLGCVSLPIGAPAESAGRLPRLSDAEADLGALDRRPWPMGDEGAEAPQPRPAELERVAGSALDGAAFGGRTSAVLVLRNGRIVAERYGLGHDRHTSQRTWSVAKSLAGTLIGHGVQRGIIRTDEAADLTAWRSPGDPRAAITVDQLIRMASGLTSDTAGNRTDDLYMGGTAVADRSPRWPLLHPPGSHYRYANNDTLLATMALMERLPETERLGFPLGFFRRLGMTRTIAETDWQGNFILSSQVWTTARDLARLGLLYLQDGVWQGERLLPEGWREYVTRASGPQPEGDFGYGATFWLMNRSEGVPPDSFAAFGNRGQYLVIVPSRDLVIVRRGYDSSQDRFDVAAFTRAVVAALD
ncbi:serine hydrolase [Sphingosinicella sp. CPCC 101087]|uniref:serine hydrolase domain-containing protein n=1 Tax=Sphingosinicella sp. CPCC 101087 TaxID=2497754 RepID=UPI001FB07B5D|nr:serine hydrolase [Sphingosinicella sp. CPCC 101087]